MSFIGTLITLGYLITNKKPSLFYGRIHLQIGDNWGGLEMGPIFITDKQPTLHIKQHECGHGIQNVVFGPLMPFLVSIPSAIRYWLREMRTQKIKYIYSIILCTIFWVICAGLFIIGVLWWEPLIYISIVLALYFLCIFIWLIVKEIPKYKNGKYIPYDSIWFEGQATRIGEKLFPYDNK
jgi:hypothetical protein